MTQVLGDVLRRTGVLGLAIAVAAGIALFQFAESLVSTVVIQLLQKADEDLSVEIRGDTYEYSSALAGLLALGLVVGALVGLSRWRATETRSCPDCLSEIPRAATVCRSCTSEVGRAP
jgi:hypothetical protein